MATLAFTCGYCKVATFGAQESVATHEEWDVDSQNIANRFLEGTWVEVCVPCARCHRLTILYFFFWLSSSDEKDVDQFVRQLYADANITKQCDEQHPSLTRKLPAGSPQKLSSAWREAEVAYSTDQLPTVSTIAYRRVLESAAQLIAGETSTKKVPLGARLKKLREEGVISDDLMELTNRALSFGNAAAHESDPLTKSDAAVARDLAEAFLRQAYSVPKLLKDAERVLQKRSDADKEKLAKQSTSKISKDEN